MFGTTSSMTASRHACSAARPPAAQTEREQIIPFDCEIFEREAGIRRKQLVEHALRLPVRLHAAGTDGRLAAGIGDVQREELPHGLDAELVHQPPDRFRLRRYGQVVIADELCDARAPQPCQSAGA